jgi:hypothetical protein
VKAGEPAAPGAIHLDVTHTSVPLHPGARVAFDELRKEAGQPPLEPQPTTTN